MVKTVNKIKDIRECKACSWAYHGKCLHPKAQDGSKPFPGCEPTVENVK